MSKCDIIIPVWNQPNVTEKCLNSILGNTGYPYNLIIVDNGSRTKTHNFIGDFKTRHPELRLTLIINDINLGFVKAINQGIKAAREDYICILNNDTIVTEGWLKEMVKVSESNQRIGIVNPSSNNLGQKIPFGRNLRDYAKTLKSASGRYVELMNALGFCMLIKKSLVNEIGLFDEIYGMGNFEDTDFSMRAKEKGYLCVRALGSYVYHRENTSFNAFRRYRSEFEKNKGIFESRWGRQKRILFIISKNTAEKTYGERIQNKIKQNNFVYVATNTDYKPNICHSGVRIYHFKNMFNIKVLLKILFKKKKFDEIYCDNGRIRDIIQSLKPIHRIEALSL